MLDRYLHDLRAPPTQCSEKPQTAQNLKKHY
ncbi:hypothetical protein HNR72_007911 [Streptomyces collinus]|uniref:Uncharacterized protein n=1 Tax=Streptomyces collinus TaxID=42684 RepID=A0AA89TM02_STRCU|nr:hypothetical protein [Streptomyces collinus]